MSNPLASSISDDWLACWLDFMLIEIKFNIQIFSINEMHLIENVVCDISVVICRHLWVNTVLSFYHDYDRSLCLALWQKSNTRMLETSGICFKQHFYTRYLVFYNTSPSRMFLSLDLLWEYRIQHGANRPLYVTSSYSTWIFCRGVSGFATDCPCGVWFRGLTTCLLHVGPPFGNRILNNSWAVGLT